MYNIFLTYKIMLSFELNDLKYCSTCFASNKSNSKNKVLTEFWTIVNEKIITHSRLLKDF